MSNRIKLVILEDYFTSDGALYKGDIVYLVSQTINDPYSSTYTVETKMGKLFTIEQSKAKVSD
tara:strand:- start:210 stop:398 length:189 start_codon:yes stop_codon:yes gene_type:complete